MHVKPERFSEVPYLMCHNECGRHAYPRAMHLVVSQSLDQVTAGVTSAVAAAEHVRRDDRGNHLGLDDRWALRDIGSYIYIYIGACSVFVKPVIELGA